MLSIQEALRQMQEAVHIGSGVDPMRVGVWMIVIEEAMREKEAEREDLIAVIQLVRMAADEALAGKEETHG